jgi:hypothetical protein
MKGLMKAGQARLNVCKWEGQIMPIEKRTIRYGGAMLDHKEIDAVMDFMQRPYGMVVGQKVGEFEGAARKLSATNTVSWSIPAARRSCSQCG